MEFKICGNLINVLIPSAFIQPYARTEKPPYLTVFRTYFEWNMPLIGRLTNVWRLKCLSMRHSSQQIAFFYLGYWKTGTTCITEFIYEFATYLVAVFLLKHGHICYFVLNNTSLWSRTNSAEFWLQSKCSWVSEMDCILMFCTTTVFVFLLFSKDDHFFLHQQLHLSSNFRICSEIFIILKDLKYKIVALM